MKVQMQHKDYEGKANVKQADVPTWEAAGWRIIPQPDETPKVKGKKK